MFEFMLVLVIGTSIWMAYDSAQLKIPVDSKPYSANNGSAAWFLSGVLLWIATFPYYLVKRSKATGQQTPSKVAAVSPAVPSRSMSEELAALAQLHAEGKLTDGDYERAKSRIIG